jgi:putative endonuclease
MFTVYALYSPNSLKHYYGYTSNMEARMLSHNILGHDWASRHRPWTIIYTQVFDTKQEAMKHEKWLKTGAGRALIKSLPHPTANSEAG